MVHFQNGCRKLKKILIFTERSNHDAPIYFTLAKLMTDSNNTSEGHYIMYFEFFKNVLGGGF